MAPKKHRGRINAEAAAKMNAKAKDRKVGSRWYSSHHAKAPSKREAIDAEKLRVILDRNQGEYGIIAFGPSAAPARFTYKGKLRSGLSAIGRNRPHEIAVYLADSRKTQRALQKLLQDDPKWSRTGKLVGFAPGAAPKEPVDWDRELIAPPKNETDGESPCEGALSHRWFVTLRLEAYDPEEGIPIDEFTSIITSLESLITAALRVEGIDCSIVTRVSAPQAGCLIVNVVFDINCYVLSLSGGTDPGGIIGTIGSVLSTLAFFGITGRSIIDGIHERGNPAPDSNGASGENGNASQKETAEDKILDDMLDSRQVMESHLDFSRKASRNSQGSYSVLIRDSAGFHNPSIEAQTITPDDIVDIEQYIDGRNWGGPPPL